MRDNGNPCHNCPEQGCGEKHASCVRYTAWLLIHGAELDNAYQIKTQAMAANADRNKRIDHLRKQYHRKSH